MGLLKKIKDWRKLSKPVNIYPTFETDEQLTFTKEEMLQVYRQGVDEGYKLGYPVGRNEGIAFAKEAAIKNLKEVIWQQNKQKTNSNPSMVVPSPSYKPSQNSALTNGRELHVPGR